jgi:aspartyl-tRNA(Asn)/glutamyl-tRNA(Gln) amidotransferase subunit A
MSAFWQCGATELLRLYKAGSVSPVEVVESCFGRITSVDGQVGAFRQILYEEAVSDAKRLAAVSRESRSKLALYGIPVAIKELFDVKDATGCYGSEVLASRISEADATVVTRLREAGAIIIGLTRAHEFGWGITTQHHSMGSTQNPWNLDRVPGGSSGGSAAAVAAGMAPIALASDTGGSIRIPAAVCGIFGIKPTYGRIPKRGGVSLAPSMDHPGPLARNVDDLSLALKVMSGFDLKDSTTLSSSLPQLNQSSTDLNGVRVGRCKSLHLRRLAPDYQNHFERVIEFVLSNKGILEDVSINMAEKIRPTFATIQMAEAFHVHKNDLGTYPSEEQKYGRDVVGRLMQASEITLSDYLSANQQRLDFARQFDSIFQKIDVLITPITAAGPSTVDSPDLVDHYDEKIEFRDICMDYTVPQDLLGLPTCAVPVGFDSDGLPVGVQVTGPKYREDLVLHTASVLSEGFRRPMGWPVLDEKIAIKS